MSKNVQIWVTSFIDDPNVHNKNLMTLIWSLDGPSKGHYHLLEDCSINIWVIFNLGSVGQNGMKKSVSQTRESSSSSTSTAVVTINENNTTTTSTDGENIGFSRYSGG